MSDLSITLNEEDNEVETEKQCQHTPSDKNSRILRGIDYARNSSKLLYYPCYEVTRCIRCNQYIRPSKTANRVNTLLTYVMVPSIILCWFLAQKLWHVYIYSFAVAYIAYRVIEYAKKYALGSTYWSELEYSPKTEEEFVHKEQERLKERDIGYKIAGFFLGIIVFFILKIFVEPKL